MSCEDFYNEYDSMKKLMTTFYLQFLYNLKIFIINEEKAYRRILYKNFYKYKRNSFQILPRIPQKHSRNRSENESSEEEKRKIRFDKTPKIFVIEYDFCKIHHLISIKSNVQKFKIERFRNRSIFGFDNTDFYSWDLVDDKKAFIE